MDAMWSGLPHSCDVTVSLSLRLQPHDPSRRDKTYPMNENAKMVGLSRAGVDLGHIRNVISVQRNNCLIKDGM